MSNNKIFSDEDKDYIETTNTKIETETKFDYYEIKKKMIMNCNYS